MTAAVAEISDPVAVFQAAGPSTASIQGSVDQYRAAVSVLAGRREINWDGGNIANQATSPADNPFTGFQITRGAAVHNSRRYGIRAKLLPERMCRPEGSQASLTTQHTQPASAPLAHHVFSASSAAGLPT